MGRHLNAFETLDGDVIAIRNKDGELTHLEKVQNNETRVVPNGWHIIRDKTGREIVVYKGALGLVVEIVENRRHHNSLNKGDIYSIKF